MPFSLSAHIPFGIQALPPDVFLCELLEVAPGMFLRAVEARRLSLKRPPKSVEDYLATLRRSGLNKLAVRLGENRV